MIALLQPTDHTAAAYWSHAAAYWSHCCSLLITLLQPTDHTAAAYWSYCCSLLIALLQPTDRTDAAYWSHCCSLLITLLRPHVTNLLPTDHTLHSSDHSAWSKEDHPHIAHSQRSQTAQRSPWPLTLLYSYDRADSGKWSHCTGMITPWSCN
jgi:hypothetical protein